MTAPSPLMSAAATRRGLAGSGGLRVLHFDGGGFVPAPSGIVGRLDVGMTRIMNHVKFDTSDRGRTRNDAFVVGMEMFEQNAKRVHAQLRSDSGFAPGMGGAVNPSDLTHKMRRVLEEKKPPLQAVQNMTVNTEVPPGAATYRATRSYTTGQAVAYRGQSPQSIGEVSIGGASVEANVVAFITRVNVGWLENMRAGFAGIDVEARKMRGARRVMDETIDRIAWLGDDKLDMFGCYNHPYMDMEVSDVDFGGDDTGTPDEIANKLSELSHYSSEASKGAFEPNTLLIAPKLFNYIANKKFADGSPGTILSHFREAHPHIKNVKPIHRFNDIGGDDVHGMLFMRSRDEQGDSSLELVVPMAQTVLPPQVGSLSTDMFIVTMFGGVLQNSAGDNLFVLVGGR